MSFCISDEELDALYGLPHLARLVYVFGIRPYMDYSTGVVGRRRRISIQGIREELYVEVVQGRNEHGSPGIQPIRTALKTLESAGLIARDGDEPMVFRLPHAKSDFSAQKNPNTWLTDGKHANPNTEELATNGSAERVCSESEHNPNTWLTDGKHANPNTPPVSGIRNNISTVVGIDSVVGAQNSAAQQAAQPTSANQTNTASDNGVKTKKARKARAIKINSGDYQPTEWAIGQLSAQGVEEAAWIGVLGRFQHYYSTQTGKTVEQWDCKFVEWAISDWKRQIKSPTGTANAVVGRHNKGLNYEQPEQSYQRGGASQRLARESVTERQARERALVDKRYADYERWAVIDGGRCSDD